MSIDDGGYWGAFTDLERASGIPDLLYGNSRSNAGGKERRAAERRREIIDLISHLNTVDKIRNKVLKKILKDELRLIVYRYAKDENLPSECVALAQQPNALPVLIKGFFKKIFKVSMTVEIINDIENLSEEIYQNVDLDIAYDLVARIQGFVHVFADKVYGDGAHLYLPKTIMKNLLSTARLHLNVNDIQVKDATYLLRIFTKSKEASDSERDFPRLGYLPEGKRNIRNWRVLHLMSIMQYQSQNVGRKIDSILCVNGNQNIEDFKLDVIKIYSGEAKGFVVKKQELRWL